MLFVEKPFPCNAVDVNKARFFMKICFRANVLWILWELRDASFSRRRS